MWILKNEVTGEFYHLIHDKIEYTIGRTGTDIILRNDSSISRSHAKLRIAEGVDEQLLEVTDLGSKYGIFQNENIENNIAIKKNQNVFLKNGDRIRFGLLQNIWKIDYVSYVTMTSSVPASKSKEVEEQLQALGGTVISQWREDCTHLTMSEITVTVKLLHALLEQLPIVTCDYWKDLLAAARRFKVELPLAAKYLPKHCEALQQNLEVDLGKKPERNRTFAGMTFIFMSRRHFEMYALIVEKAGGEAKDLKAGVPKAFMIKEDVVVVQYMPSTQSQSSQTVNSVSAFLEAHSRRLVPEYEIGLAILHCSTSKYCNPSYKGLRDIMPATLSMGSDSQPPISDVYETIPSPNTHSPKESYVVEETKENTPGSEIYSAKISESNVNQNQNEVESADSVPYSFSRNSNAQSEEYVEKNTCTESARKRKRNTNNLAKDNTTKNAEDSDDEALCSLIKRPNLYGRRIDSPAKEKPAISEKITTTKKRTPSKISPKPLTIEFNTRRSTRTTANTELFLEKSKAPVNQKTTNEKQPTPKVQIGKRTRISVITDDDDNDDLFCFGDTETAGKKRRCNDANESDDELFGFIGTAEKEKDDEVHGRNEDVNCEDGDDDVSIVQEKQQNSYVVMPKPMPLPKKMSIVGWLSCSLTKMTVKEEIVEKSDLKDEPVDGSTNVDIKADISLDENQAWLRELKGGFEVRLCAVSSTTSSNAANVANDSLERSLNQNNGPNGKNFKAFVRKSKFPKQTKLVSTICVPVVHQRII